jgi:hypothetical protein
LAITAKGRVITFSFYLCAVVTINRYLKGHTGAILFRGAAGIIGITPDIGHLGDTLRISDTAHGQKADNTNCKKKQFSSS